MIRWFYWIYIKIVELRNVEHVCVKMCVKRIKTPVISWPDHNDRGRKWFSSAIIQVNDVFTCQPVTSFDSIIFIVHYQFSGASAKHNTPLWLSIFGSLQLIQWNDAFKIQSLESFEEFAMNPDFIRVVNIITSSYSLRILTIFKVHIWWPENAIERKK